MRRFEYALTLASGFAPTAPVGTADGGETELIKRAHHPDQRDAPVDLFEYGLVECQEAKPTRLAAVKSGS